MENKTFTLIGKFDDQITKKLRDINKLVEKISKPLPKKNFSTSISNGLKSANVEMKALQEGLKDLNKYKFKFDKSGLEAATQEAKVLGKELQNVSKAGLDIDRSGLKAAQEDAKILGNILKANALIKVGEGVGASAAAGFSGATSILGKAGGFIAKRFNEAVGDQLQDIQARGSLFGSLNKEGLFSNAKDIKDAEKLREINDDNYDITRNISRSMEGAIADVVKSSTVSTETITILSRQLSDNLLPSLLKAKGVTDLSRYAGVEGRKRLDEVMGGEKGVGTELARLYEQMGSITSSPAMAGMTGMGFAQFLGSGSINRQLRIFETNPVLVDAMKQGLAKYGNTIDGRIKALKEALEIAMPEAALMEARTTIAGGMQSISDTLTNASAGILSMGADIAGQGAKTLEMAKRSGAYARQVEIYDKRYMERRKRVQDEGGNLLAFEEKEKKDRERFLKGLTRLYENADSPIEVVAATFGPLMQSFADMLGSSKNLFIDPINAIMAVLQKPLVQLQSNFENLGSLIRSGKMSLAEALGRAIGEFFKVIATLFSPGEVGDKAGGAIQKVFDDFTKGFKSVKGDKFMKDVLDGITKIVMAALFKGGNVMGGLTPLGDGLVKVFALLAAPAFIGSLSNAIFPLILGFVSQLLMNLSKKSLLAAQSMVALTLEKKFPKLPVAPAPVLTPSQKLAGLTVPAAAAPAPATASILEKLLVLFRALLAPLMKLAILLTVILIVGGGVENSLRQLGEAFGSVMLSLRESFSGIVDLFIVVGQVTTDLINGFGFLFSSILSLIPGIDASSNSFDLLKFALVPLTATFDLLEMTIRLAVEGLQNFRSFLVNLNPWASKEEKDAARAAAKDAADKRNASRRADDVYYTSMRYGGAKGYSKVLERDVLAKQRSVSSATTEQERLKLNSELFALNKTLAEARKQSGASPGGRSAAASLQKGVVPPLVPASLTNFGDQVSSVSKITEQNLATQKKHLDATKASQAQALKTEGDIRTKWATVNVGSQQLLLKSAGNLASAINRAAAKITVSADSVKKVTAIPASTGFIPGSTSSRMTLGEAIYSEMENKPPGSSLVIANSSETVIPAAGGYSPSGRGIAPLSEMGSSLNQFLGPVASLGGMADALRKLTEIGGIGGAKGSLSVAKQLASKLGLIMTSYLRTWPPGSYHTMGRAMDFSDGVNTPGMMKYAKMMVSRYGKSLAELIYTPLGFSIKHGRKVAPLSPGNHYDHVHVAFGLGAGNPAFFSSQAAAQAWERKMMPTSAKVASVTTNSSEGFGSYTLHSPITIYQQPNQDSEELANMVAIRLSMAINELRNHYA